MNVINFTLNVFIDKLEIKIVMMELSLVVPTLVFCVFVKLNKTKDDFVHPHAS